MAALLQHSRVSGIRHSDDNPILWCRRDLHVRAWHSRISRMGQILEVVDISRSFRL